MTDAGADVETIETIAMDIKPCLGCFTCWTKTPGKCIQKDDMGAALMKIAAADLIVYATPVYVDGMTGTMKNFVDRGLPLLKGQFEIRNGHCRHALREHVTATGKAVLFAVSGFPELDNFDPLIAHIKAACRNMSREFVGAILRPCAWLLPELEARGRPMTHIYDALRSAGREVVTTGSIDPKTIAAIEADLVPKEIIVKSANTHVK